MSTTVSVGGFEVTGTTPADAVVSSLTSTKEGAPVPKVLVNEGQKVEEQDEAQKKVSEAASELGKLGGKAAAEKRAAEAKEKPEPEPEQKAEPEAEEEGDPKEDPIARMKAATRKEAEAKRAAAEIRARAAEAERRAAALEQRLAALERERTAPPAEPQKAAPRAPEDKPRPDQFDDYEKYLDARDEWNKRQWERGLQERQQVTAERMKEAALQRTIQGVKAKFFERVAGVPVTDASHREKFSEFMETVSPEIGDLRPSFDYRGDEDPSTLPPWQHTVIADLIVNSPDPRSLMSHLSGEPDEFRRLATLQTPHDITWEMAKVASRLEAATSGNSPKPEPSKAKPPVRPVTGSPHIAEDSEYRPGMSFDDYAKRNAKRFKFPKP